MHFIVWFGHSMAKFLTPKFRDADIKKYLQNAVNILEQAIISRFSYIGETFVTNARNNHTYRDVTGNLTASIFYQVLKNGKRVGGSSLGTGDAGTAARSLMAELKVKYNTGFVLIVGAGMDYAAAVESRGKDVLTASSLIAKQDLQIAIQSIKDKLKRQNG